ncbi:DUF1570 domain-containing protein [Sphingomonas sp. A2-49]|uniref:DUF1570 domain-containing protein n=1 Tax=Sphingomonas sp. A2-49 TaxID=1391375 RepID=UPI0021CE7F5E|nr:DUF1570 domain-containing protein [Sphingomonas sp. A2-49]MCU6454043.1 DUF1570 domain-containing protein [Sphingomonas sp. A2-49]
MAALVAAQPARAEWFEATSAHFVVYADGGAEEVRRQAEQLERFDSLIRYFNAIPAREEDGSNRLTVYVVANDAVVRRMFGAGGSNIAGFYQGRASGSVAFTPARSRGDSGAGTLQPQIVLFHEYAHHLMLANTAIAVPAWYGEGYAEFLSTARFDKDVVWVGAAAQHRAYELLMQKGLSAEQLFSLDRAKMSESQTSSLYARGWLMTHYLTVDTDRRRQLNAYLLAVNAGKPGAEAARAAFGDLRALDTSLAAYLGKSTLPAYKIPLTRLPEPKVVLRPLRPGEKAMIGLRMRSDRGVNRDTAQPILAQAVPIGERYADDPVVQGWLAEMALDAGRHDLADAAADRALALDPKSAQALVYKAQVHLRRATAAKSRDPAVWKEARGWLLRANRLDPNDAYALMLFYSSFGMARAIPTDNAKAALRRAHELVPQDPGVGYAYAIQSLVDGRTDDARGALRPLAYSAHSGPGNPAAKLLVQLDAGKGGVAAMAAAGATVEDADQPE